MSPNYPMIFEAIILEWGQIKYFVWLICIQKPNIKEITKIGKQYFVAKDEYKQFRCSDKIIEIYSSQEVKNCFVEFEVPLNNINAFIAGRKLEYNEQSG